MDKTKHQKEVIHSSIVQMLERMKVVDGDSRFSMFMEMCGICALNNEESENPAENTRTS